MEVTQEYLKDLTYRINGAAIEVHKILGPGLLESVYHNCLKEELRLRDITFLSEYKIPVNYKGITVNCDFFCDLIIEDLIIVELKAVKEIIDIHRAQLMTYLSLLKKPKGIIYNFNVERLYPYGQETLVSKYFNELL